MPTSIKVINPCVDLQVNAGKQSVAMSIYAILYNEMKSVNIWDTSIMNTVLENGNNLYSIHRWKKSFSFWDRGPNTLKFSASFALFQVEYLVTYEHVFLLAHLLGLRIHIA